MNDKTGNNKNRPGRGKFFEQFPGQEKERLKKIWELTGTIEKESPEVSSEEIEEALSGVHRRIGGREKNKPARRIGWRWMAAAAVILIVFGAGILLFPHSATAPYGEQMSVTMPDGSNIELNSGSRIQYNRVFGYTGRTVHLDGEAFFSVEEGDRPFRVETENSIVEVTGTEFNVRSWRDDPGGETEVSVSEGNVQFYRESRRDSAVTIMAGQISRLAAGMEKPSPPEPVSIERITGWRDDMLNFNEKSLLVIFRELERRFNVDIRLDLEDENLIYETLTTYYADPDGVESVLQDICRVKGLRFSETANGYRVYK